MAYIYMCIQINPRLIQARAEFLYNDVIGDANIQIWFFSYKQTSWHPRNKLVCLLVRDYTLAPLLLSTTGKSLIPKGCTSTGNPISPIPSPVVYPYGWSLIYTYTAPQTALSYSPLMSDRSGSRHWFGRWARTATHSPYRPLLRRRGSFLR